MSPEQTGTMATTLSTSADLYSLGVVLYELITGDTPLAKESLEGCTSKEVTRRICHEEAPAPSSRILVSSAASHAHAMQTSVSALKKQAENDLDWIVLKALRKEPENRYQSVGHFSADLRKFLDLSLIHI